VKKTFATAISSGSKSTEADSASPTINLNCNYENKTAQHPCKNGESHLSFSVLHSLVRDPRRHLRSARLRICRLRADADFLWSFTLNNIATNQSGDYTVMVSNAAGSVPSQVATLTVMVPVTPPLIEHVIYAASTLTLSWNARPGRTYQVQVKDDLNQASLSLLANVLDSPITVVHPSVAASSRRFYRIVLFP
jgi:hypothetical protein